MCWLKKKGDKINEQNSTTESIFSFSRIHCHFSTLVFYVFGGDLITRRHFAFLIVTAEEGPDHRANSSAGCGVSRRAHHT